MYELMQKLVAFKYACKLNHWGTDSYAKHLLFDRLQEGIDDYVDKVGEEYFMASSKKQELKANILSPELINLNLSAFINDILNTVEKLAESQKWSQGMQSLIGNISEGFNERQALITMK